MQIPFDRSRWMQDSDGVWLCLRTTAHVAAKEFCGTMEDKPYDADLKQHREKRSLDANAYMWKLLDKLSDALHSTKDELYRIYIKRVGVFRDYHLAPDEAKSFQTAWSLLGTGWRTEQVDYTGDGNLLVIRAYFGSSRYNTKQMSRLIDMVVEDCKEQGIETLPPDKLDAMKLNWGRDEQKN